MDNRRLVLAVAVSVAFLFLWTWLFTPPQRPKVPDGGSGVGGPRDATGTSPEPGPTDAAGAVEGSARESAPDLAGFRGPEPVVASSGLPPGERVAAASEEEIGIETDLQEIRLTNRGGRVTSWRLKNYIDDEGKPLDLVSAAGRKLDHLPLQFLLEDPRDTERLRTALHRVSRRDFEEDGRGFTEVTLEYSDGAGLGAKKTLRVPHDGYVAEVRFAANAHGAPVAPTLVWGAGFDGHTGLEKGNYADTAVALVKAGARVERRRQPDIKPETPWITTGSIAWGGLEDKYFAALLVPPSPKDGQARFETLRLVEEGREHFHLSFACRIPGVERAFLFVGPKDYDLLKGLDLGLEGLLDFGFFGAIALPLFYAMKFLERYVGNFGWAIVILTILIRLLFFPFMHRGQLRMRKMQDKMKRVQPKVKALRERYRRLERKELEKGNASARHQLRQKMNEEMMALYKEENINPLGSMSGCLPLLLQIPILYAFYTILTMAIELRRAPFIGWIKDLSRKDPYYVTPIVMGVTMLIQQAMTSSSIPDPTQRRMMFLMPIIFTYFFVNLPSGLVLYWLVNNLLGIAQQYLINRQAEAESRTA
jgi:YidC/Oxa1 family membrane protein insertase